jgi:ribonuclease PH
MTRSGRSANELRRVTIERGYTSNADGSVLISFGDTRVLCTALLERKVPGWLLGKGRGWITAEYAMLPASASEGRISRDAVRGGRALEISRLIGRSLRSVVDLAALGEVQVTVDCDVIQADGGTRTAAITGGYVALHDALAKGVSRGTIARLPLTAQCAAVSVGLVGAEALLDLCYVEDSSADVDLNLVMRSDDTIIEVQGTAERVPFRRAGLDAMMDLGREGILQLFARQREALGLD